LSVALRPRVPLGAGLLVGALLLGFLLGGRLGHTFGLGFPAGALLLGFLLGGRLGDTFGLGFLAGALPLGGRLGLLSDAFLLSSLLSLLTGMISVGLLFDGGRFSAPSSLHLIGRLPA